MDPALGYTHNDMGPLRLYRPLIRATRVQTLAISCALMIGLSLLMGTMVMVGAVGIMGMDASHLPLLWLYSVYAIAVCGIGALALLAVFGTPGMLVVTLVYIAMAVPTAGATTPIEALPGFYRLPRGVRAAATDHRRCPLDPLLRRPGRRGADPGMGHDGRRSRCSASAYWAGTTARGCTASPPSRSPGRPSCRRGRTQLTPDDAMVCADFGCPLGCARHRISLRHTPETDRFSFCWNGVNLAV